MAVHDPHCTQHSLLHAMQYSRLLWKNGRHTIVKEELQFEISQAGRRPLVHTDYDAASCYDQITLNLASLASHAYSQIKPSH